ncbi:MAG: LEA type 2 family protein, partial [Proteobacteria bacterium]|nr:LEA type 2 family protein [Pseudomonadota bacterium]
ESSLELFSVNRLAALAFSFLLAACASIGDVTPPSIQLSNMRLVSAGLLSQELMLQIRIGNPNDFDIPLKGLSFTLDVNGESFAEGLSNESVTVPRLGYATLSVAGSTSTLNLFRQLMALGNSDRIAYRLHGKAYVDGVAGRTPYPFDRKGELTLPVPTPRQEYPDTERTFVPSL